MERWDKKKSIGISRIEFNGVKNMEERAERVDHVLWGNSDVLERKALESDVETWIDISVYGTYECVLVSIGNA